MSIYCVKGHMNGSIYIWGYGEREREGWFQVILKSHSNKHNPVLPQK